MFASKIRWKRVDAMRQHTHSKQHLDEVFVRVQGEMKYMWRAVDHEGEELESFVTTKRDNAAALKFMKKLMKRHGCATTVTTDGLHNHFNQERHLLSRAEFKTRRSAALAERRQIVSQHQLRVGDLTPKWRQVAVELTASDAAVAASRLSRRQLAIGTCALMLTPLRPDERWSLVDLHPSVERFQPLASEPDRA